MKHFINDRSAIVTEAIDTAVMLGEGKLARLDGFPAIKVVVRADWKRDRVAIISGGGAGHEPAHVGFVGEGMLTAAVCGEIFASPSVEAVLAAILAVTGPAGALLIVKNYTGDRLNFGLAAEKARALGLAVEVVIVGDDIALPESTRPRGVAGTLFVHKVAGELARSGASLAAVKAGAERVAAAVRSLGISLFTCTIPGQTPEQRIGPEEVELGLGIHGEPGAETIAFRPVAELARIVMERVDAAIGAPTKIALLINALGGVPPMEMAVATRSILAATKHDVRLVFGPAPLMTALDMKGFSVSAIALDADLEAALLAPVGPTAWSAGRSLTKIAPLPMPARARSEAKPSADPARRKAIERVCLRVIALEAELDAIDAKVGDGDTGSTSAAAARAVLSEIDRLPLADPPALCAAIADRLSTVMGGSSGILLSIGFAAMAAVISDPPDWYAALGEGVRRIEQYGGAKAGDRTMLDALIPATAAGDAKASAVAARNGADATAAMTKARAGRSGYVPAEALRGVPDPGAIAIAEIFAELARD